MNSKLIVQSEETNQRYRRTFRSNEEEGDFPFAEARCQGKTRWKKTIVEPWEVSLAERESVKGRERRAALNGRRNAVRLSQSGSVTRVPPRRSLCSRIRRCFARSRSHAFACCTVKKPPSRVRGAWREWQSKPEHRGRFFYRENTRLTPEKLTLSTLKLPYGSKWPRKGYEGFSFVDTYYNMHRVSLRTDYRVLSLSVECRAGLDFRFIPIIE